MREHPCPVPDKRGKGEREGALWACDCGRIFVLRNHWNYAGDVWRWHETNLRIEAEA